jgi:acyl-CoA synthetase (NDP forming)
MDAQPDARLCLNYGFQLPRSGLATSADEAAALATDIGFPVVLKITSPDLLHKTDAGGVALNLDSPEAVRQAYARITALVQTAQPQARIQGVEAIVAIVGEGIPVFRSVREWVAAARASMLAGRQLSA